MAGRHAKGAWQMTCGQEPFMLTATFAACLCRRLSRQGLAAHVTNSILFARAHLLSFGFRMIGFREQCATGARPLSGDACFHAGELVGTPSFQIKQARASACHGRVPINVILYPGSPTNKRLNNKVKVASPCISATIAIAF